MSKQLRPTTSGPFTANQLREGDPYELSNGHPILCLPGGAEHAGRNLQGGAFLDSDPDVEWAGVDAGFSPEPGTLRAPDIAVGPQPTKGQGWIPGVPPLAVEYASSGQDEAGLKEKIADLLAAGTRYVWVVRLIGPRRVEVHTPGKAMRVYTAGEQLEALGVLRNPVPVQAFFDRATAQRLTLNNLLQREGYASLEAIQAASKAEGKAEGALAASLDMLLETLAARGLAVDAASAARLHACRDPAQFRQWLRKALTATRIEDLLQ